MSLPLERKKKKVVEIESTHKEDYIKLHEEQKQEAEKQKNALEEQPQNHQKNGKLSHLPNGKIPSSQSIGSACIHDDDLEQIFKDLLAENESVEMYDSEVEVGTFNITYSQDGKRKYL